MIWEDRIAAVLPDVARRAGRREIRALAERLQRNTAAPAAAMVELVVRLSAELVRTEQEVSAHLETLAIGRNTGSERGALLEVLSRTSPDLAADLAALDRALDGGAVEERLALEVHRIRQQWDFLARATAASAVEALPEDVVVACREAAVEMARATARPWTMRAAACRLAGALSRRPTPGAASARQDLLDLAHRPADDPWVQAAALEAWLELQPRPEGGDRVLLGLALPAGGLERLPPEHLFVRARVAQLAGRRRRWDVLRAMMAGEETSEHVRSTVTRALARSPRPEDRDALLARVSDRSANRVERGAGVVAALPDDPSREEPGVPWIRLVGAAIAVGRDPWLVALAVRAMLDRLAFAMLPARTAWACLDAWGEALAHWRASAGDADLAESAAALQLSLRVQVEPAQREALLVVRAFTASTEEGASARYREGPVAALSPEALLDVLALAAWDGMDLSATPLRRGYRLFHGAPPRFSLWRVFYELARPRPDKRQAHSHVTDRVPPGTLIALSGRLAEVTPTAVVGQRGASPTRLSWGAALPLPSLLLAASRRGGIRLRTPSVSLTLAPVRWSWAARLAAHLGYQRLADTRDRLLDGGGGDEANKAYDAALLRTGFRVERHAAWVPLLDLDGLLSRLVAIDTNTIGELVALSAGLGAFWVGRNLWRKRQLQRWRAQIPLVVGGWGSRGKSGTERLKAALFHGTGYAVTSKTTGCEAMVVMSIPGRDPTEIFLYRPYDKATIVEQQDVVRLAATVGSQVMLWECMALNPSYVEILQQDWMHDDLATVTNTYPDHEDIQGPTGRDVAEVISRFIPPGAQVATSEQHMTPVLTQQARRVGSALAVCRPEEWLLLPADLLARFPYNEHPRNIALVVRMAALLGLDRDVALRAMADHVVPDLGVLKEYGPADYEGRRMSFVNGCSANERAGFLSNWQRMGMADRSDAAGLDDFTTVVVNNRADRLARQGVFARIAALDVAADSLVVIGTNVQSFTDAWLGNLRTALRDRLLDVVGDGSPAGRTPLVDEIARRLRRPILGPERAREVLVAQGAEPTDVDAWIAEMYAPGDLDALSRALVVRPRTAAGVSRKDAFVQWLREVSWLHRLRTGDAWTVEAAISGLTALLGSRALPLTNPGLSGDQVIHAIAMQAPPGVTQRVLGSANIKGTGLDFVYRWISVDKVLGWLAPLPTLPAAEVQALLRVLGAYTGYGIADAILASEALDAQVTSGRMKVLGVEDEAVATLARLKALVAEKRAALAAKTERTRADAVRHWFASALDFVDSVRRKRESEALYADLAVRRVAQERAADVAKGIVYRQKK